MSSAIAALLLSGCLLNVGPGPDLGECASPPDGIYTYGEIGIGTCLSGPADLAFFEQDGSTWLAVTNADPFRNFDSGSVLLIDWDSVDFGRGKNLLHELDAYAVPTDPFVGGLGHISDRDLLLVSNRYSEDARTRSHRDELLVIDVSDPRAPVSWSGGGSLTVEDDPFPISIDDDADVAYVVNLTDHSITVIDTAGTPLRSLDIAGAPELEAGRFDDADNSGSVASMDEPTVQDTEELQNESWTLSWIDGTYRIWAPEDGGLRRYTSGNTLDYASSLLGVEIDPSVTSTMETLHDPVITTLFGNLSGFFVDDSGILRQAVSTGAVGDWAIVESPIYVGGSWDARLGGPSLVRVNGVLSLFYDGRTEADAPASIGLAFSEDGQTFTPPIAPLLNVEDTPWESLEDPFVINDPFTGGLRMWLSLWDGQQWRVGLTESLDGIEWSEIEVVLEVNAGHAAAPVVQYSHGRYLIWLAHSPDGVDWNHAVAWSWDGRNFAEPTDFLTAESTDLLVPPRVGIQVSTTGAWRVEGDNAGVLNAPAFAGSSYLDLSHGISYSVASGQLIDTTVFEAPVSENGLSPGSYAEIDGVPTLYVTTKGPGFVEGIGALQLVDGDWQPVAEDIIPEGSGGNVLGASDPVVWQDDGAWTLFYSAVNAAGERRIRRATSANGLDFTPVGSRLVNSGDLWDSVAQRAHSVEPLEPGVRLWYTGFDGEVSRIGSATSVDGVTFAAEPGDENPFQFGPGTPGDYDDAGVADPWVMEVDGVTHLFYAGFDGTLWRIGHAIRGETGAFERSFHPVFGGARPALLPTLLTFANSSVSSPVILPDDDLGFVGWYAGFDNFVERVGELSGHDTLFPHHRFPTVGDTLQFETRRGDQVGTVIELEQRVASFSTTGTGVAGLTHDTERGMLYLPSKLANALYVIDARDDSSGEFVDRNYRDIETMVRIDTVSAAAGLRSVTVDEQRDRLYVTSRSPDGVIVLDRSTIVDNDSKEVDRAAVVAQLPLRLARNEGPPTIAPIGGNGMALTQDGRYLLVTHFRGNSLTIFDLDLGAYGEEIAYIPYIGENPHHVVISPDGRHAVVANYLGEIGVSKLAESTLAVIDLDPNSETYLEAVTWLANR